MLGATARVYSQYNSNKNVQHAVKSARQVVRGVSSEEGSAHSLIHHRLVLCGPNMCVQQCVQEAVWCVVWCVCSNSSEEGSPHSLVHHGLLVRAKQNIAGGAGGVVCVAGRTVCAVRQCCV